MPATIAAAAATSAMGGFTDIIVLIYSPVFLLMLLFENRLPDQSFSY